MSSNLNQLLKSFFINGLLFAVGMSLMGYIWDGAFFSSAKFIGHFIVFDIAITLITNANKTV